MNCLEFKRLALSEPNSSDHAYVEHAKGCADCLKYVGSVRKMDIDLEASLDVTMPSDLIAKLQLNQVMQEEVQPSNSARRYAMAASVAVFLFVAGFVASNQFGLNSSVNEDYQALLAGVVEHMHEQPITPVWSRERANRSASALLASYDGNMKIKPIDKLQFTRICPMGVYKGLHASIETQDGSVTFAYIKGEPIEELVDAGLEGYVSRVKPLKDGNLIIISRTQQSLEQVDAQLEEALYWEI